MSDKWIRIYPNGTRKWYQNGSLHREDRPAVEFFNGDKEWWVNGELHREDGPALKYHFIEKWFKNGKLHRVNGPAIKEKCGSEYWLINDKLHRRNGPAVIYYISIIKENILDRKEIAVSYYINNKRILKEDFFNLF